MTLLLPRIIVLLSRQIDDGPGKPKKACRMIAPIEALSFSTAYAGRQSSSLGILVADAKGVPACGRAYTPHATFAAGPASRFRHRALILPGGPHLGKSERCGVAWHQSLARSEIRSWTAFSNLNRGVSKKAATPPKRTVDGSGFRYGGPALIIRHALLRYNPDHP
jgi:hypothetical protein